MSHSKGLDISPDTGLPVTFERFRERFPDIVKAHTATGQAADAAGPLDARTRELVKIGICLGAGLESATKSHARRALEAGATPEEVEQAILQGVNTCGFPRTVMTWVWATEQMEQEGG